MSRLVEDQRNKCLDSLDLDATINYWDTVSCPDIISAYLTIPDGTLVDQTGKLAYVPERMEETQAATGALMKAFDDEYTFSADSAKPEFVAKLIDYCRSSKTPGVCETFLADYCSDLTVDDRDRVSGDPFLTTVCGCYIPPDPAILEYANDSMTSQVACPDPNSPEPGAACDGLCRPSTTIKRACTANGQMFTCPQNVCVIDQVSIDSSRSRTGDVNLNTLCAGCEEGCVCITEVDAEDENLNVNINQVCGDASVCFQKVNGVTTKVACTDYSSGSGGGKKAAGPADGKVGYLPLGMLLFIVLVIGILVLLSFIA